MVIQITIGDIISFPGDVIVIPGTKNLSKCELQDDCLNCQVHQQDKLLKFACDEYRPRQIKINDCLITQSFNLPSKFIIHVNNTNKLTDKLKNSYLNPLNLAASRNLKSIAFPSFNNYQLGAKLIYQTITEWLVNHPNIRIYIYLPTLDLAHSYLDLHSAATKNSAEFRRRYNQPAIEAIFSGCLDNHLTKCLVHQVQLSSGKLRLPFGFFSKDHYEKKTGKKWKSLPELPDIYKGLYPCK